MEYAQILSWLAAKTPEFVIGFALGLIVALIVAYVYLLPRFVKSATLALTTQVELLSRQSELLVIQVNNQTQHIANLETQINKLEHELEPYRAFANTQLAKIISAEHSY
jgi:flagellar biogenesis protein FliO